MPAPLIEPEDRQPDERLEIRLRPDVARDLRAYGEYVGGSSPNYVVSAALKRLFREDRGFRAFWEANPSAGSGKVQGIRRHDKGSREGAA